jgi:predicted ATPase/DNA-binding winged helix-turn-helix (wHTH) protein
MNSNRPELEIDLDTFQFRRGGKLIEFTPTELELLRVLIQHKNQTLSHKFLLQAVWGDVYGTEKNFLYAYVKRIREKLKVDSADPQYLLTKSKAGYQWVDKEDLETPAGSNPASQPKWHSVPPVPLTSFIGRERELALLERLIRKRTVHLLTVTGPGGIGKTRLSVEFATHLHDLKLFPDGIHFVDLEPIDNPEFVVSAIAQTVGIREKPGEDLLSSLKRYLYGKTMLLMLDNFEHITSAANQVLEILKASRDVKFLVTSRERLNQYGEHTLEIPPLSLTARPSSAEHEAVPLSEAVQLFVERAQAADAHFELDPVNLPVIQQICDRLEGLPLAVELAAVNSRIFALPELLKRLDNQLKALVGGHAYLPARQRTLQATIDWSYQLLDASDQSLFVSLSVFNGTFTLEAVEAVCAESGQKQIDIAQGLISLLNKSLLKAQRESGQNVLRYGMPVVFREFGSDCLGKEDAAKYGRRHAEYYLNRLATSSRTQPDWLALELGNLRAALGWAIANESGELALGLSVGMYELWQRLGMMREGKQWLFDALDAAEDRPTPLRARALFCAGALTDWLGEHQIAQSLYRESLEFYELLEDDAGVTSALQVLAAALINQGDFIEGRSLSEQSLRLAREQDSSYAVALALNNLGMIAVYQGDALTARPIYLEMHALFESLNIAQGKAWALTGLSWAALLQGNYLAARNFIDQSLELHRQSSDMLGTALALACDSWIALYRADFDEAVSKLQTGLALCRDLGLVNLSIWPLVGLARIYLHQGDRRQTQDLLDEALRLCQQLNFPPITAWVYLALGISQRLDGEYLAAFDEFDRALNLSHKRDDNNALVAALEQFAVFFVALGKSDMAVQLYGAAARLREMHALPLSTLDRIEFDLVTRQLQSDTRTDWGTNWHQGRALDWNGILQLIHQRPERFE